MVGHGPGAVGKALGGGVIDSIPDGHDDACQDHGILDRLQEDAAEGRPGGHVLPAQAQVGQDGQHDCHGDLHPEYRVLDSYFPVDVHDVSSF